ncbi:hypothetical protein F5Y00DRAFT_113322 [Daldinia vernicosa]|uniref:uncharacterized protein n=1 Tax=Daldinia vernicosa TaxID=114800 RepID=UPI002007542B|nr:uncharacterized protein F5Y00DRAFT_113322 [Daldinia vernicosa]KAI0847629.1 hypothetical protein F5Y00DRAFT_113322 [Daldinia vernicosa]
MASDGSDIISSVNQARINVTLSTSPTLSLSDPKAELRFILTLQIVTSAREGHPITICTDLSALDVLDEGCGLIDVLARGAFGALRSASGDATKNISLGYFHVRYFTNSTSSDLREHGKRFVTIPGDGSPVTVVHRLIWERIFKYADRRKKDDLVPGDRFNIAMNRRFLRSDWWCWGDLESDLKDKHLHVWHPGRYMGSKPDDEEFKDGSWVFGEDPQLLTWEDVTEGRDVSFEIVE